MSGKVSSNGTQASAGLSRMAFFNFPFLRQCLVSETSLSFTFMSIQDCNVLKSACDLFIFSSKFPPS